MRNPLSRARWSEVENLFVGAAELPPEQRQGFVQSQCGLDKELQEEVFALLRYDTGGLEIQQTIALQTFGIRIPNSASLLLLL